MTRTGAKTGWEGSWWTCVGAKEGEPEMGSGGLLRLERVYDRENVNAMGHK